MSLLTASESFHTLTCLHTLAVLTLILTYSIIRGVLMRPLQTQMTGLINLGVEEEEEEEEEE